MYKEFKVTHNCYNCNAVTNYNGYLGSIECGVVYEIKNNLCPITLISKVEGEMDAVCPRCKYKNKIKIKL